VDKKLKVRPKKTSSFFPRKLVGSGGTRTLSVGKILPPSWNMVKVSVLKLEGSECILKLERLM